MTNPSNQVVTFGALKEYLRRSQVQTLSGTVISIARDTAYVKLWGSNEPIPCAISSGIDCTLGDTVFLMREPHTSDWVVVANYTNRKRGASSAVQTPATAAIGSVRPGNVVYYAGGVSNVALTTTYAELGYINFVNKSDTFLVGCNYIATTGVGATAVNIFLDVYIDGVTYTANSTYIGRTYIPGASQTGCIGFTVPFKGIPPGKHRISIMQFEGAAISASGHIDSFWAMDM